MPFPLLALAAANPGTTSAILSGVMSIFGGRSKRKEAEAAAKARKEEISQTGDEDRKTVGYEKQLADYYARKKEDDIRRGYTAYTGFARGGPSALGNGITSRLINTQTAPVAPQALVAPGWESYSALPPPKKKG